MKKSVFTILFPFLLSLLFFPQSFAWAEGQPTVPILQAVEGQRFPPLKKELRDLFYEFEGMYWKRQEKGISPREEWEGLGDRLSAELGLGPQDDIVEKWQAYSGRNATVALSFYLRGALLMGESYLFSCQEHLKRKADDAHFRLLYEKGILILEEIIAAPWIQAADYLPSYSRPIKDPRDPLGGMIEFLPYAGFETIGTGFEGRIGAITRKVTSNPNRYYDLDDLIAPSTYHDLHTFRKVLPAAREVTQIATRQTARALLADFCPWGVGMYFAMKKAGMTEDLDFAILRPFTFDITPTYTKPFLVALDGLEYAMNYGFDCVFRANYTDAVLEGIPAYTKPLLLAVSWPEYVKNYVSEWLYPTDQAVRAPQRVRLPPLVHDGVLDEAHVPVRIRRAMEKIVGVELRSPSGRIHRHVQGNLGGLRDQPVRWLWVGNPSYNIWFLSPRLYDWNETDWLWTWFTVVKVWYGGPLGVLADEGVNAFKAFVDTHYGEGPVQDIRPLTTLVVENYDKGVLLPSLYTKGEWLDASAVVRKIAAATLQTFTDQAREDNFGGIVPRSLSMGQSYNGDNIPPTLIRSSVLGFEDVPEDEYPRFLEAVRFFKVYPEFSGSRMPHQQLDLQYMDGIPVKSIGWWTFSELGGSFEIITSFAPERQVLSFTLTEESAAAITEADKVTAELWTVSLTQTSKYATVRLDADKRDFTVTIFNVDAPSTSEAFQKALESDIAEQVDRLNPDVRAWLAERTGKLRKTAAAGQYHMAVRPLRTAYQLRIAVNDGNAVTYPINIYQNRAAGRSEPTTGKVLSPAAGVTKLNYEPEISIPLLQTSRRSLIAR